MLGRRAVFLITAIWLATSSIVIVHEYSERVTIHACTTEIDYSGTTIRIDNATITSGFLRTELVVQYTRFEVNELAIPLILDYGPAYIGLLLSLDNVSYIRVITETYDDDQIWMNGSGTFTVENSLFASFPFNLGQGAVLYLAVERGIGAYLDYIVNRTPSVALTSPVDIIRPWYFTIDWRFVGEPASIVLVLIVILVIARRQRKEPSNS
jgi:hypothetical protein